MPASLQHASLVRSRRWVPQAVAPPAVQSGSFFHDAQALIGQAVRAVLIVVSSAVQLVASVVGTFCLMLLPFVPLLLLFPFLMLVGLFITGFGALFVGVPPG